MNTLRVKNLNRQAHNYFFFRFGEHMFAPQSG